MSDPLPNPPSRIGQQALVCFGLFGVFFVFYVGAALLQTPAGAGMGSIRLGGIPLGFALSLAIFPVTWLLIALWFWKAK